MARQETTSEVTNLKHKMRDLKVVVADLTLADRLYLSECNQVGMVLSLDRLPDKCPLKRKFQPSGKRENLHFT